MTGLNIYCGENDEVAWDVATAPLAADTMQQPFGLRWPTGVHVIDPRSVIELRRATAFSQLYFSDAMLFVYFERVPILLFQVVRIAHDESRVLSVAETD